MPVRQIKFHEDARKYASQQINLFITILTSEARLAARRRGDSWVLNSHIDEALETIKEKQCRRRIYQEVAIALGSAFFGAFLSGFVTELTSGKDGFIIALYVVMGIIGTSLGVWGFVSR